MDVKAHRPKQRQGSSKQSVRGAIVASPERATTGGTETLAGPRRHVHVRPAELALVERRLLEVIAEDLVQLDERGAVPREPPGVALVQLRSHRLRQTVVRRVADEQVAEP